MFTVTYTALGKDLKRYTLMKREDVEFSLKMICPTYHNFKYKAASFEELSKLSSPINILTETKTTTFRGRVLNRPCFISKHRNHSFPINKDYVRTNNIWFFEDELQTVALHYPELAIFLISD